MDESDLLEPVSVTEWRSWLEKHHATSKGVWLVQQKKGSTRPGLRYEEALEEALAFGWIDSKVHRLDEERMAQWYSPRKPKSQWSRSNVTRVQRLLEAGRMTPAGMAAVEQAKRRGVWDDPIGPNSYEVPSDLDEALCKADARDAFEAFAPSYRQMYLHWVLDARTPSTRQKRIARVVENSLAGRKPGLL